MPTSILSAFLKHCREYVEESSQLVASEEGGSQTPKLIGDQKAERAPKDEKEKNRKSTLSFLTPGMPSTASTA